MLDSYFESITLNSVLASVKRHQSEATIMLWTVNDFGRVNYYDNNMSGNDIELEEWDAIKSMKNGSKENMTKIKLLKDKKDYKGMLELANSLPNDKDTYLYKANAYLSLSKWQDVIRSCDIGLELGEDSEFWHYKGKALGKLGRHPERIKAISQAVAINRNIPAYHRNLGAGYYAVKDYERALECHNRAIQLQPKNPINYHNKGAALLRNKLVEQAIEAFDQALERDSKLALSMSWKGDCFRELGKLSQAIQLYDKAYKESGNEVYLKEKKAIQEQLGIQPTRKKFLGIF